MFHFYIFPPLCSNSNILEIFAQVFKPHKAIHKVYYNPLNKKNTTIKALYHAQNILMQHATKTNRFHANVHIDCVTIVAPK